jgi:chromosomal replication initiator protein
MELKLFSLKDRYIPQEKITAAVLQHQSLTFAEINTNSRKRELAYARMLCIYMLRMYSELNGNRIAKLFKRDHTTVIYAMRTINNLVQVDEKVRLDVDQITALIAP